MVERKGIEEKLEINANQRKSEVQVSLLRRWRISGANITTDKEDWKLEDKKFDHLRRYSNSNFTCLRTKLETDIKKFDGTTRRN